MGLSSMTGFASAEGAENGRRWAWEARSVNSRGLDIRFRAPSGLEALEAEARRAAEARFRRGALQISLQTGRPESASTLRLNEESLDQALAAMTALEGRIQAAPPQLEQILGLKGVLELVEAEEDETAKAAWRGALAAALEALLDDLARSRALEGEKLDKALSALLGEIEGLNEQARASAAAQPSAAGERLKRQVAEFLAAAGSSGELDEGRLAQELA
ncbi:MAG: YicC/YloC family endoribonuclease, partial [Pseudomonadota bacterium]